MIYTAISHLIEEWTGIWLCDCFRAQIQEPLGMVDTFFSLSDAQEATASGGRPLATPYYCTNRTRRYHGIPWLSSPQVSGCGATLSNVIDYSKWLHCMMTVSAPLSPAGHEALRSPRIITDPIAEELAGSGGSSACTLGSEVSNYPGDV